MLANIMGVQVDMAHPDMQFKTLKDLRAKENVFDHIPVDARATAQRLLWQAMGGKENDEVEIIEPKDHVSLEVMPETIEEKKG